MDQTHQVSISKELKKATELVHAVAKTALQELGTYVSRTRERLLWMLDRPAPHVRTHPRTTTQHSTMDYQVGTMLELPRACLLADTLAVRALLTRVATMTIDNLYTRRTNSPWSSSSPSGPTT